MLVSAKLLNKSQHKIRYAFGESSAKLDGVFQIDLKDLNQSFIETASKDISSNWALRTMAAIALETEKRGKAPEVFVYCSGH